MNSNHIILKTKALNKHFQDGASVTHAVSDVNLSISEGEYLSLTGESGSGKSTLLAMLGLIEQPTSGAVFLAGVDTTPLSTQAKAAIRNKYLGFVFQSFHLVPTLSVYDNVALPLRYSSNIPVSDHEKATLHVLELLGIKDLALKCPDKLSGGQQQRVAIGRALVTSPKLILADEPTGNLDSKNSDIIKGLLNEIHQMGTTIIVVTHEPAFAALAQRQINMVNGQIQSAR
ncbi:MAG: ABC transporter ATP-binding protein [Gammaproteobacteria bacterium CG22_combo_CG10-13_8_21_14_all_40_8]|nr:MAG: ABC transporter ATP-binding protein [Gammaproteobacteria bacterium CG22_combo_CG10-13_8_21_14_all_40_8]